MPAAPRWSPMPARTENSSACSISISQEAGQRYPIPSAAGVLGAAEARCGDGCVDRTHPRSSRVGLRRKIATADRLLYRRGNFSGLRGSIDLRRITPELDTEIALSPGFRWGSSVLPGQPLTMEDVLSETAISYPETYLQSMTGSQIKEPSKTSATISSIPTPIISRAAIWCASAASPIPVRPRNIGHGFPTSSSTRPSDRAGKTTGPVGVSQ